MRVVDFRHVFFSSLLLCHRLKCHCSLNSVQCTRDEEKKERKECEMVRICFNHSNVLVCLCMCWITNILPFEWRRARYFHLTTLSCGRIKCQSKLLLLQWASTLWMEQNERKRVESNLRIAPERLINAKLNSLVQAEDAKKEQQQSSINLAFDWASN